MSTTKKSITSRAGVRVSSTRPSTGSTAASTRVSRKTQSERRTSKPRTAYDLCELVAQHIEAEPLRYAQHLWGFETMAIAELPKHPKCGTVCCRAGWIVALHDGPEALHSGSVAERANDILGLAPREARTIYYDERMEDERQGTKAYATIGAAGLRAWAKRHAKHLKARLLSDVPKLKGQS